MKTSRSSSIPAMALAGLAVFAACQPAADATDDASAAAMTMEHPAAPSVDDLLATERSLWTAFGAHDPAPFEQNATADATLAVAGAEVLSGRDAIVETIRTSTCDIRSFDLQNAGVRELAPGVVLLSYDATQDSSCDGQALPPRVHSTSIYVWREGRWQTAAYQETPLM